MKVVIADLSLALYSIRSPETYQVASSYPLAPPSTLLGAFAYALHKLGICKGSRDWKDAVRTCLEVARGMVDRIRDTSVSLKDELIIVRFPTLLRRLRKVLEEGSLPENIDELQKYSDALIREYVLSSPRKILVVPRKEDYIETIARALWLIDRVGDSESHVAVRRVRESEATKCDDKRVNVVVNHDTRYITGGIYTVVRAYAEDDALSPARDSEKSRFLAVPVVSRGRGGVFYSSYIEVKDETLCVRDGEKSIVFPAGRWW